MKKLFLILIIISNTLITYASQTCVKPTEDFRNQELVAEYFPQDLNW